MTLQHEPAVTGVHDEKYVLRGNQFGVAGEFLPPDQCFQTIRVAVGRNEISDFPSRPGPSVAVSREIDQDAVVSDAERPFRKIQILGTNPVPSCLSVL